jgi:hypothetical protein
MQKINISTAQAGQSLKSKKSTEPAPDSAPEVLARSFMDYDR